MTNSSRHRLHPHIATVAIVVSVTAFVIVSVRVIAAPKRNTVYDIYVQAARHWLRSEHVYRWPQTGGYRYSPAVTVLLAPFAYLPTSAGAILWRLVNVAFFAAGLAWCCSAGIPRLLARRYWPILVLLTFPLALANLNNGQANLIVCGLLLIATAAALRERWWLAALAAAGATLFKIYPISFALLLCLMYPRRFAPRFFIALALGMSLPFLVKPWPYVITEHQRWLHYLQFDSDRHDKPIDRWYQDARMLSFRLGVPLSSAAYKAIQLCSALAIAGATMIGRVGGVPRRRLLALVLGMSACWMTTFGSATEQSTYLLIAPSLAWLVWETWLLPGMIGLRIFATSLLAIVVATHAALWFPFGRAVGGLATQPAVAIILLIWLLVDLVYRSQLMAPARRASGRKSITASAGSMIPVRDN